MDILTFVVTIVFVTASGALAPGPLFFATITHGSKTGAKSGIIFSIAHTVVEFSLIMLFALGLLTVASEPTVKTVIGIAGGIVLVAFGIYQIYNSYISKYKEQKQDIPSYRYLFLIGLAFTGLNPYFILWWLTVGAQLIVISLEFAAFLGVAALLGVIFMYICHVWMDYVWLTAVAHFSKKGTNILGLKWSRPLMMIFGAVLIYFGITFFIQAMSL